MQKQSPAVGKPFFQPKLTINQPNDVYEQEADAMADKVMRMEQPFIQAKPLPVTPIQRKCAHCEEEEKKAQRKEMNCEETEAGTGLESYVGSLSSGGTPLSNEAKNFYEPQFGYNFSNVRIHNDTVAAKSAQSINALAYTSGNNIVFNSGQYSPNTDSGKRLLGHELTHVVQQGGGISTKSIQRLKITKHTFTKGKCRARNIEWIFSLDNPATADGYIVQHIENNEIIGKSCPIATQGPPAPVLEFWEAWPIKKGDKIDWTTVRDGWTDGSPRPSLPNSNGYDYASGTVKFFLKSVTGDLGDFGAAPADPKSSWGPGKVTNSGALPSTSSKPSWWDNPPAEGPAKRFASSAWNCCDADPKKQVSDVDADPK